MTPDEMQSLCIGTSFVRKKFYVGDEINSIDDVKLALSNLAGAMKLWAREILLEGASCGVITEQTAESDIDVSIAVMDLPEDPEEELVVGTATMNMETLIDE